MFYLLLNEIQSNMNNKLTEIAINNSFERYVYSKFSRITFYVLNVSSTLVLMYFITHDLEELKRGYRLAHFVSLGLWVVEMAVMVLLANHSTKKSLGCTIFSKKRGKIFRKKIKKRTRKIFLSEAGKLSKMGINEAKIILEKERESVRSEYRKLVFVSGAVVGIVWYQFVEAIFNFFVYKNFVEIVYVFIGLMVLCIFIIGMYFLARSFLLMSSKIGKIESFISILNEVEYDSRENCSIT